MGAVGPENDGVTWMEAMHKEADSQRPNKDSAEIQM